MSILAVKWNWNWKRFARFRKKLLKLKQNICQTHPNICQTQTKYLSNSSKYLSNSNKIFVKLDQIFVKLNHNTNKCCPSHLQSFSSSNKCAMPRSVKFLYPISECKKRDQTQTGCPPLILQVSPMLHLVFTYSTPWRW